MAWLPSQENFVIRLAPFRANHGSASLVWFRSFALRLDDRFLLNLPNAILRSGA
jgi:hypothetical protein